MKKQSQKQKVIYNFEFPSFCDQLDIFGYVFQRISEYQERVRSLHQTVSHFNEFKIDRNTGNHAITSVVNLPNKESKAVLPWGHENPTALDDILLLLSLFTSRQVFSLEQSDAKDAVIVADPREYFFGRNLRTSLEYIPKKKDEFIEYDQGFEKGINDIYKNIRKKDWLQEFGDGYFLFIFREACKRQILETSFTSCWAIWEHLFYLHNKKWLSEDSIRKLPSKEKIAFVLSKYKIKENIEKKDRKGIERFVQIRNRLIHTGRFPDEDSHDQGELFIRITEQIIDSILRLKRSDTMGTLYTLDTFLSGERKGYLSNTKRKG